MTPRMLVHVLVVLLIPRVSVDRVTVLLIQYVPVDRFINIMIPHRRIISPYLSLYINYRSNIST